MDADESSTCRQSPFYRFQDVVRAITGLEEVSRRTRRAAERILFSTLVSTVKSFPTTPIRHDRAEYRAHCGPKRATVVIPEGRIPPRPRLPSKAHEASAVARGQRSARWARAIPLVMVAVTTTREAGSR